MIELLGFLIALTIFLVVFAIIWVVTDTTAAVIRPLSKPFKAVIAFIAALWIIDYWNQTP